MKNKRLASFLGLLAFVGVIASCKSLPSAEALPDAPLKRTPTVATQRGMLDAKQASQLLTKRWANATADLKQLAVLEEQATGAPLIPGNQVTLLFDGPATMRDMMNAARDAKTSINLETYIFDQDPIGLQFADILIEKRRQGVVVNIMADGVGTLATPKEFFERLRAAGINVLIFNPVDPTKRPGNWQLNNRDHRKIMIVDGKVGFTGGINISETYANSSLFRSKQKAGTADKNKVGWRDTHIRIEGPAVATLQWAFIDNWVRQDAGELPAVDYFPRLKVEGDKVLRVLATSPDRDSEIYKSLMIAMNEAKQSIHVTSAYFVPDQQIVDALIAAAKRGVDVKLVLPGVSDHDLIKYAGQAFYDQLLSGGVKIFQLQVAVLHAKTAVIDGIWSTIGSANIDRRSFIHNYELNVVVLDPAFGRAMESAFNEDLRDSKEVTLEQWRHRPWKDRLREMMGRLAEYWI
ncbi:cardiolipin synthase [Massilia yuzhufengensis]|uniref:Cardiolipin synthase n=1 Tax=Massilia yuzhufengensis TaxID=1164594 RepID=A0A1I1F955_9BURK|nr:cardiolipin synthase [Massilia yuzhufengensis]SFB93610.1 cardiolipin synthase [Massilia yuzhufengensis]